VVVQTEFGGGHVCDIGHNSRIRIPLSPGRTPRPRIDYRGARASRPISPSVCPDCARREFGAKPTLALSEERELQDDPLCAS
jgi:hypothetical protein